jgi:hypothetical protein
MTVISRLESQASCSITLDERGQAIVLLAVPRRQREAMVKALEGVTELLDNLMRALPGTLTIGTKDEDQIC